MSQVSTGSTPTGRPPRAIRWWLAGGAFVIGVLAGVVIAGLLIRSTPDVGSETASAATSSGTTSPVSSDGTATDAPGAEVQIVVNDACLRAINAAQDAYSAIERVGSAVADFDLTALDGIIRELQPLQQALRDDVAACNVQARLPDGSLTETSLPGTTGNDTPPSVAETTVGSPTAVSTPSR